MFRLANNPFKSDPRLNELATYVLTESIKSHLATFFDEEWEEAPQDEWVDYVKQGKVLDLIPLELEEEFEEAGFSADIFFSHKVAQMMEQLLDPEPITFDLIGEYVLAQMIYYFKRRNQSYPAKTVEPVICELKDALLKHYQALEDYEKDFDEEDRFGYEAKRDSEKALKALTDVKSFLDDEWEDENYVFWDADYTLIDDWGLGAVLKECGEGCLAVRGYGPEEVERMVDGLI